MHLAYDHQSIEEKWLEYWEEEALFQNTPKSVGALQPGQKSFLLFAFAYPSGSGLHVGHVESKTALDILARMQRMQAKEVYFPVGWDAFGLPAENYAIKTGIHPTETTKNAINTFRRQIKRLGISYDWANEIATSHPEYYKWTQWIFLQLYNKNLAYQKMGSVNWCPSCQTVLANEQVVEGECERCDSEVSQKDLKQWYFGITKYKDELISGLDQVDWPHATKQQQLNWIGRKSGINITYGIEDRDGNDLGDSKIICFTTRPDTNFGATFIVLAPEHEFSKKVAKGDFIKTDKDKTIAQLSQEYIDRSAKKTELERQQDGHKKTGAFTGFYAINSLNGKKMPIYISDFVLGNFGTGAVVGVPGHDKRDFEFAEFINKNSDEFADQKIEVIRVVISPNGDNSPITKLDQVQEKSGKMMNSEFLDGLDIHEATLKMMDHLEKKGWGERVTTYKLRDWLISRQRYWGAPIPVVYDPDGNPHPVTKDHLPWDLPTDVDFKPTGESPLKSSKEFTARTEKFAAKAYADLIKENGWDEFGKGWVPEFDTMDTFVDSSWYYLRYCDSRNTQEFANKEKLQEWLPADLYLIGPEHIVLHLLYSRFFTKFLRDEGYLNFDEPFSKMRHQGMILGPDGKKMSKSKGNVISPDIIIEKFGADTLRVYEMFMGPLESDKPWVTTAVAGVYRFLKKAHKLAMGSFEDERAFDTNPSAKSLNRLERKLHQTIKKVSEDIPALKFNTAIASMMELLNMWQGIIEKKETEGKLVVHMRDIVSFIKILAPFAPFLAEELWQEFQKSLAKKKGNRIEDKYESIHLQYWAGFDPDLVIDQTITIAVQVNGKVRGKLEISPDKAKDKSLVLAKAVEIESVQKWLDGKKPKKEIYVPGKIVSLVV